MLTKCIKGFVLASLLAALSVSGSLYGQILNGNIIGNVTDPDGRWWWEPLSFSAPS